MPALLRASADRSSSRSTLRWSTEAGIALPCSRPRVSSHMHRTLWRCPAIIPTVRRGAPGSEACQSTGEMCSTRYAVTRLVVRQAARSVAAESVAGRIATSRHRCSRGRHDNPRTRLLSAAPIRVRRRRIEVYGVACLEHVLLSPDVNAERSGQHVDELRARVLVRSRIVSGEGIEVRLVIVEKRLDRREVERLELVGDVARARRLRKAQAILVPGDADDGL